MKSFFLFILLIILSSPLLILLLPTLIEISFDMEYLRIRIDKIIRLKFNVKKQIEKLNLKKEKPTDKELIKEILKTIKAIDISIRYISTPDDFSIVYFQSFINVVLPFLKILSLNNLGHFYYRGRIGYKPSIKINASFLLSPIIILKTYLTERRKEKWKNSTKKLEKI